MSLSQAHATVANDRARPAPHAAGALQICLVTSLSVVDFVDPELTAEGAKSIMPGNVGVLTLAAVLRRHGYAPDVVNLDRLFLDFRARNKAPAPAAAPGHRLDDRLALLAAASGGPADSSSDAQYLLPFVMQHIDPMAFDVFGLSSICSSYPLTMRLAAELKRRNPAATVIVGGPQASVVDVPTLRAFDCVDFVVRGEAEESLPALLAVLSGHDGGAGLAAIPGITFRANGEVVRNRNAPVIKDLDTLPPPAFDLDPDFRDRGSVYLEIGRGCPFACTFCSTNDFFRRNFRLKSTAEMLREMQAIRAAHGIANFSFIHDMYTIDHKKVAAFAAAVLAAGGGFSWACSARTDCIDRQLIDLMADAGCRGIFFGIETGSPRLQSVIKKRLDLAEAWDRIASADRRGVKTAVALICGFPEETRDDFRDTIHFFVNALRFDNAEPQLSLLAPLAGTPIYEDHKSELILDDIFSDVSHQGWQQNPADLALIEAHPAVFPNFYAVPTRWVPRRYFKQVRDFVTYLALRFRWLPVGLLQDSGDFLQVFDLWQEWTAGREAPAAGSGIVPYYCSRGFRDDFLAFVSTCYIPRMARAPAAVQALVQSEATSQGEVGQAAADDIQTQDGIGMEDYPFRPTPAILEEFGVDYKELTDALRQGADLATVTARPAAVLFRQESEKRVQVWQMTPASAALIRLCDGRHTVAEIARAFAALDAEPSAVPPDKACLFGLLTLRQAGFIRVAPHPVAFAAADAPVAAGADAALMPLHVPPPEAATTQQPWPWLAPEAMPTGAPVPGR